MCNAKKLTVAVLFGVMISHLFAADSLEKHFQSPPDSAKPHTWWHWMNGNVTAEGITADLEAMKRVGVGGFQAFHISRMPEGPVNYMSKDWRKLMQHTISEANRLGLEVCLHNCAGWSSSGGPWITPEYAMQKVIWTEQQVAGGKLVEIKLTLPKLRVQYFRDIAVLAFPTPESERGGKPGFRVDNWQGKAGFERDNHIKPDVRNVESGDIIDAASIVDLSDKMDTNGQLKWKAPKGRWTIVRFGYTPTGQRNRPAPPEGSGLECDKLSKAAVELHWKYSMQKVIDDVGSLAGKVLSNILIDSYEVGQQNWTKGFEKEFQNRMGYDLKNFLPALTGRVVKGLDITERFLWDFRRIIADLFAENYYGHFAEMCHRNELLLSIEPYGKPGNLDDFAVADIADIPMGEWWARTGERWHHASGKMAASAAHTHGRRHVGAEAFTAGRAGAAFVNYPYMLKAQGDYFFCKGVNRFIFHTFVHQPWNKNVVPGMTMGPWGFQNNRNNTWYEQGKTWNQYLARSQYLLQEGRFQADLCYFAGENAPQTFSNRADMKPVPPYGYDYDTISSKILMKLTVKDGRLVLPGLMEYRLLVMPEGPVRSEVLTKVQALLEAGAHVVWAKPESAPGLQNYPESDRFIQQAADKIWGPCDGENVKENAVEKGIIYWPGPLDSILESMGLKPDVEFDSVQAIAPTLYPGIGYEWIHQKIGSADIYLVSNQQEVSRQVKVVFRSNGRIPELWYPQTGETKQAPVYGVIKDGRTFVKLFMEPAEAVFVVFRYEISDASVVDMLYNGTTPFSDKATESAELTIHQATYGDLNHDASRKMDITAKLQSLVSNNSIEVVVGNKLAGRDPAYKTIKQLRVSYSLGGRQMTTLLNEKETLKLGNDIAETIAASEPACLAVSNNGLVLSAWQSGEYESVYSDGKRKKVNVSAIPEALDLSSDWKLHCPEGWGPSEVILDKLISWTEHSDPEMKYFSGTAVYKKQFDVPTDRLNGDGIVNLDLGGVKLFAEVILNGQNLGILWKPPYKLDVSGLLKSKDNNLEIRVTNLWVNRLIGDAQYSFTDEYVPEKQPNVMVIKEIPDWLKKGETRPETKQKTFTTCRFYTKDSPLVESGMLGPVTLNSGVKKYISE